MTTRELIDRLRALAGKGPEDAPGEAWVTVPGFPLEFPVKLSASMRWTLKVGISPSGVELSRRRLRDRGEEPESRSPDPCR